MAFKDILFHIDSYPEPTSESARLDAITLLFFDKFSEIAQYAGELPGELAVFELQPSNIAILDYRRGFGHVEYVSPDAA